MTTSTPTENDACSQTTGATRKPLKIFLGKGGQQIKTIGAQASPAARLQPGQLRQLIRHWPGPEHAIVWHVLVLVGQKR